MKKSDFRIGNIVQHSIYVDTDEAKLFLGDEYSVVNEWQIDTIIAICYEYDEFDFYLENGNGITTSVRVDKILITPEWLEKCGFHHRTSMYNQDIYTLTVGNFNIDFAVDELFQSVRINGTKLTMYYMHELQNLYYALTAGKELLINIRS